MTDSIRSSSQPATYKKPQIWKAVLGVVIFAIILMILFWFVWPFFQYIRTGQKTTAQNPVTTTVREVISQPRETLLGANLSLNTVVTQAVKGDKGETGPEGTQGAPGPAGQDGVIGKDGTAGKDGVIGKDGSTGADGATGPAGSSGSNGTNGSNGAQGAQGAQGPQGDPGVPDGNAIINGGNAFGSDLTFGANDNHTIALLTNGTQQMTVDTSGNVVFTNGTVTASNGIIAGAASSGRSSLHINSSSGTNVSSPTSGDLWWNGTNLYFYDGTSSVDLLASAACPTCFVNGGNAFGATANLGTTDNNNLNFITNNAARLQLTPDGRLFSTASAGLNQWGQTFTTTSTEPTISGGIQTILNILHNSPLARFTAGINSTTNYNNAGFNAGSIIANASRVNILAGSVTGAFGYAAHVDNYATITSAQGLTGNDIELDNHTGATTYEIKGIQQIIYNHGDIVNPSNPVFTSMESEIFNYGTTPRMTTLQMFPINYGTINGYMINSYNSIKNYGTVTADLYGEQIVTDGNGIVNGDLSGLEIADSGNNMEIDGSQYGIRIDLFPGNAVDSVYGEYIKSISGGAINNYGLYIVGADNGSGTNASLYVENGISRFAPGSIAGASINIPSSGAVDTTSPNAGDLWFNGTNLYFNDGSTNHDLLAGGGGGCSGTCFLQGGNAFGADAVLGTTDDNSLSFLTNNTVKATILDNGKTTLTTDSFTDGGYGLQVTANLDGNTGNAAGGGGISSILNVTDSTAYNARLFNGVMTHSGTASTGGLRGTSIGITNSLGAEADSLFGGFINTFNQGTVDNAFSGQVVQTSNSGTAVRMDGVQSQPTNESGGLITDVQNGYFGYTINNGDNTGNGVSGGYFITSGTGTTTNLYGLRLQDVGSQTISGDHKGISIENDFASNTITGNDYGIYVNEVSAVGSANNYGLYIGGVTGASGDNFAIYSAGGDSYLSGALHLGDTSNNVDGNIRYNGTDFEGYTGGTWLSLTGGAAGAPFQQGGNAFGSYATLGTTDDQELDFITNNTVRGRISNNGYFGIGNINPDALLTVEGDFGSTYEVGLDFRGDNGHGSMINITQSGIGAWAMGLNSGAADLSFWNNRYIGNPGTEAMRLTTSNNLGIGNFDDEALLGVGPATTGKASININDSGATDVASPNSGDLWWNGTNLYFNNGSTNYDLLGAAAGVCPTCIVDGGNATGNAISLGTTDTNALNFLTNNTNRMTIDSSGKVGIGTTGPGDFLTVDIGSAISGGITIQGTPTTFGNFGLIINNQSTGGHNWFIDSTDDNAGHSGNLLIRDTNLGDDFFAFSQLKGGLFGIGTNDPTAGLTISDSASDRAQIHLSGNGADVSSPNSGDLWWNGTNLYFNDGSSNIDLLAGGGGGFVNGGNSFGAATSIGTTDNNNLDFLTNNTTQMTLTTNGRLGIGTSSPNSFFQIEQDFGSDNAGSVGFDVRGTNGGGSIFDVSQAGVGAWGIGMNAGSSTFGLYENRDTGGAGNLRFAISNQGNVAIGTQGPVSNMFDVLKASTGDYIASFRNESDDVSNNGVLIETGEATPTTTNTLMTFQDGDGDEVGSITFDGVGTYYNVTSDERLKKDITDTNLGLDTLMHIQVRDFNWKNHPTEEKTHGFIAQDLFEVYPQAVSRPSSPDGLWQVDYSKLMPLVIKSIQDQQATIAQLQSQVNGVSTSSAQVTPQATQSAQTSFADQGVIAQVVQWNYNSWTFLGNVSFNAAASFKSTAEFIGEATFKAPVNFLSSVVFKDRVTFADKDMGGSIVVPAGQSTATVTFTKPFAKAPVVTVSAQGQVVPVAVDQVSSTSFTIKIASPLSENLNVLWTAISIQYDGDLVPTPSPGATQQSTPVPEVSPTPAVIPTPEVTPSPAVSPSPSSTPSPSATPSASPESSPAP